MCINTIGSFECMCLPGFAGDGVTCIGQCMHLLLLCVFVVWKKKVLGIEQLLSVSCFFFFEYLHTKS